MLSFSPCGLVARPMALAVMEFGKPDSEFVADAVR
jgi:hypothetical protein